MFVDHCGGFAHHTIAFGERFYFTTSFNNGAGEFMAEDTGIVDGPADGAGPLVEIAAADADVGHLEKDVIGADLRRGDVTEFDGAA